MRTWWSGLVSVCLMAVAASGFAQVATTLVQDTVYEANGSVGQGSVIVSWPAFSTMSGQAVAAGTTSITIGANGSFSAQLAPNAGAMPIGTYYTAVYHLSDGTVSREYWVVPVTTSPVAISSIRSTVLPMSVAMQTVSKSYVDSAISSLSASVGGTGSSSYVLKAGDTMTGPLVLPGDPTAAGQAADKHYVDAGTAALTAGLAQKVSMLPTGTQAVNQPAGTTLGVNDLNGAMYASQYQTGANNNGVGNAIGGPNCTSGCTVVAEPTYAAVDRPTPYNEQGTGNFGWPMQTHLKDWRGGGEKDSFQDPMSPFAAGNLSGHTILYTGTLSAPVLKSKYGAGIAHFNAENIMQSALAGGNTQETQNGQTAPYGKTTYTALNETGLYATEGQHVMNSSLMTCVGVGDCLIAGYTMLNSGGWRDGSDEGAHPGGMKIMEDWNVPTGVCASGCSAGSTQVSIGSLSYTPGEGRYLIDKNAAGVVSSSTTGCGISSGLQQNYPFSVTNFSGSNCFPVSTILLASAPVAPQANTMSPGTVTVAIATSGLPAGYAASTSGITSTTGVACVADTIPGAFRAESSFETANYTVVDGTHLSVTFNKPHGYAPTIAIGGMCGYGLESTVDTRGAIRQVVPVVGSFSPTSLYFAANNMVAIGLPGASDAFASVSSPISSISRSGNVTTVVLTNSVTDLNGLAVTVAGVADTSFNGTFPITTTASNSFTYSNSGTDASSSGGTMSFVTGGFNLYPMAEVLGVLNPATNAVDGGNLTLAPNTVNWAANDPLEEPHFHLMLTQGDGTFSTVSQTTPRPNYGESMGEGMEFGGYNGAGFVGHFLYNTTPASSYYGNGGTLGTPLAAMQVQGPWRNIFDVPAGDATVLNVHCNSHGCNRWDSGYNLFALQTTPGGGTSTIGFTPASNTLSTTIANWAFGNANVSGIGSLSIGGGAAITSSSSLCQSNGTNCPAGSGGGIAMGTAGQIPVMNAGGTAYAPVTMSGDATISSTGAVTAGANIPRLNAANIFTADQTLGSGPRKLNIGYGGDAIGWNRNTTTGAIYNNTGFAYQLTHITSTTATSDLFQWQVYQPNGTAVGSPMTFDGTGSAYFGTSQQAHFDTAGNLTAPAATATGVTATNFIAGGAAATVAAGSGAGSGATAVCASGYTCLASRGRLAITAGSSPAAGTIATVTFAAAYGAAPMCTVVQNGGTAWLGIGGSGETTAAFNVTSAAAISATVTVDYRCMQ